MGKHLLQPSEKLVQGLSKGGKCLSDKKKGQIVQIKILKIVETHPPPPA